MSHVDAACDAHKTVAYTRFSAHSVQREPNTTHTHARQWGREMMRDSGDGAVREEKEKKQIRVGVSSASLPPLRLVILTHCFDYTSDDKPGETQTVPTPTHIRTHCSCPSAG